MTRQIDVGGVKIGGGAPVVIQSMLNTRTTDVAGSLEQIKRLKTAGCQIAWAAASSSAGSTGTSTGNRGQSACLSHNRPWRKSKTTRKAEKNFTPRNPSPGSSIGLSSTTTGSPPKE